MQRNASSESSTIALPRTDTRSSGPLLASLLLLTASFVLLVLGPMLLARFQNASQSLPAAGFLSMAAASGIALGGGAAMIAVVARLLRDIELRPYAALAPVLGVFAGFVSWGLGAQLPLTGVPTEYVGVFAVMVAVAGGALVAMRGSLAAHAAGWLMALFAPLTVLALLWAGSGKGELSGAYAALSAPQKMLGGLLLGSALLLLVLAEASRVLARKLAPAPAVEADPAILRKSTQSFGVVQPPRERLFGGYAQPQPQAAERSYEPVLPAPQYDDFAERYAAQADSSVPKLNVWEMHEELELPKRFSWGKVLLVVALALAAVGAGVYYGMIVPQQEREAEAARVLSERQQQIRAADQQKAAELHAIESRAAAERLEKMLAGPAVGVGQDAPGAAPAASESQPAAQAGTEAAPAP